MWTHEPPGGDGPESLDRRAFLSSVLGSSALFAVGGTGRVAGQTDSGTLVVTDDRDLELDSRTPPPDHETFVVTDLEPTVVEAQPGDQFEVSATITNTGTDADTQSIELRLDGETIAVQQVSLLPDESQEIVFPFSVPDVSEETQFEYSVASRDTSARGLLTVVPQNPVFSISDLDPQFVTVESGTVLDLSATITNTGTGAGTRQVAPLLDGSLPEDTDPERVELEPDETTTVQFSIPVPEVSEERTFTHGVATGDDHVTGELTVTPVDPPRFAVEDLRPQDLIVETGSRVDELAATVTNTGDRTGAQEIQLIIDAEVVDERNLELSAGESTTVRFDDVAVPDTEGTYGYEIRSEDDSAFSQFETIPVSDGSDSGGETDGESSDQTTDSGSEFSSLPVDPTSPPVAIALASGGTATLVGGYALLSGGGEASEPSENSEPGGDAPGADGAAAAAAAPEESAAAADESVSEGDLAARVDEIDDLLDTAEVQVLSGDDDRALETCNQARSLADGVRADAREQFPKIVSMVDSRLERLRQLETDIEVAGGNVAPLLEEEIPALASLSLLDSSGGLVTLRGTHADAPGDALVYALDSPTEETEAAFTNAVSKWFNGHTHPNVVSIYDRDDQPQPWVAVEDVAGTRTVDDLAGSDPDGVVAAVTDAAEAIRRMELYNVRHEDLTPEVIRVLDTGDGLQGVVDDWGLRRAIVEADGGERITPYTAPELLSTDLDRSAGTVDIYGLGAVAYYGLTGRPPVTADRAAILDGAITPPSQVADLPESVDEPVMRALETDPAARYDSAYDFSQALRTSL